MWTACRVPKRVGAAQKLRDVAILPISSFEVLEDIEGRKLD